MGNLLVAYKISRQKNKQPVAVLVYADSLGLPMAQKVGSNGWMETICRDGKAGGVVARAVVSGNSHARARNNLEGQGESRRYGKI
jgi:hypothetical protein